MPSKPPTFRPPTSLPRFAPPSGPRHYDRRAWRRLAAAKRAANPICEVCGQEPTAHVHHKIPVHRGGLDAWENLQAVCIACHNHIQPEADKTSPPTKNQPSRP